MSGAVLSLDRVSKRFVKPLDMAERISNLLGAGLKEQNVRAVDDVSLSIYEGEVVALVGESGSGKSTLARMAAGLLEPTAGVVSFRGQDLAKLQGRTRERAKLAVQMIFQNPMESLNPRMRIVDIVGQAPLRRGLISRSQLNRHVAEMLSRVGLDPELGDRYPHQFSGGQRTRIGIARALAVSPQVLVCDESTAALDVSIQAQVLNLFMQLRSDLHLTYLFVTHDLGVVRLIADRVAVMYLGRIVELARTEELFQAPAHPYTKALLADVPQLVAKKRRFAALKGQVPSPLDPPNGCHFHPRCPLAERRCANERPLMREVAPGRHAACHLPLGSFVHP